IREARFVSDGGVHDLFVVTNRSDAAGCLIAQPSFAPAGNGLTGQGGNPNIVYRIPTPLLGAGLIEAIPDSAILANARADAFTPPNSAVLSDMEGFADFMRMLGPPVPAQPTVSTQHGAAVFKAVGCGLCHTPVLATGPAIADGDEDTPSIALSNRPARLFSDLLVHHMGAALADGITQGSAGPDEFRTAPLWGVGQRVFFLHDGRTSNLIHAIRLHAS